MAYRPDALIGKATKLSAKAIADSRIKRADDEHQWTRGKKTTKADKRKWIAVAYLPHLIEKLENLKQEMRDYIRENR